MADKRRGLGKGLGALIPPVPASGARPVDVFFPAQDDPATSVATGDDVSRETSSGAGDDTTGLLPVPGASFAHLDVNSIRPNPQQPRQVFDPAEMAELVHSIREIGVLQPIVVRPLPDGDDHDYEIVMGERRWRASRDAEREHIPAIIRSTADTDLLRDALLENLHRSELNPLEEAAAYEQLLKDFACTHDELAQRIGRSRPQISNMVRLLKLPPAVQRRLASGALSTGHARALLGLTDDAAAMDRIAQRVITEGLSVRGTEELVSSASGKGSSTPRKSKAEKAQLDEDAAFSEEVAFNEENAQRLGDELDTRVSIIGSERGKIVIEFADRADLERLLYLLDGRIN